MLSEQKAPPSVELFALARSPHTDKVWAASVSTSQPWASAEAQCSHASRHGAGPGWHHPAERVTLRQTPGTGGPVVEWSQQVENMLMGSGFRPTLPCRHQHFGPKSPSPGRG